MICATLTMVAVVAFARALLLMATALGSASRTVVATIAPVHVWRLVIAPSSRARFAAQAARPLALVPGACGRPRVEGGRGRERDPGSAGVHRGSRSFRS